MKDKVIFRRKMLRFTVICSIALLIEEAVMLFVMSTVSDDRKWIALLLMAITAVTCIPCFLLLLYGSTLRVNEQSVSLYKYNKMQETMDWVDASMTTEYETAQTGKNAMSMQGKNIITQKYIILKDTYQRSIKFEYDDKTYALLSQYLSAAHPKSPDDLTI